MYEYKILPLPPINSTKILTVSNVFFSILVTFFGDTKRKLSTKIFDFLKFIFFKILGLFGIKNKKDDTVNQG